MGLGGLQPPLPLASKRSPVEPPSEISAVDVQVGEVEIAEPLFLLIAVV